MRWLCLSLSLLLFCQPLHADTYSVTDEQLDAITQQTQVMQQQINTLNQLLQKETQLYQQEQQRAKRYKTLSLVLGGVAAGAIVTTTAVILLK